MKEHHLQLNLAKTELLVFPATPTLQHDFTIQFINNYSISFGQKSWCNLWWPADLQRAHCKDCSILQVCTTQHQKDQALSDRACCTTSCPGPCHFYWTTAMLFWLDFHQHNQTSTNDSECSGMTGLQRAQKSPCYTSLSPYTGYQLQLASSLRHWWLHIEQPQAQHPTCHSLLKSTSPPEAWDLLVSDASLYHHREAQNHFQNILVHHSWLVEWSPIHL